MPIYEIPREDWEEFCDSFSRQHRGGQVTIEIVPPNQARQIEIRELPLRGLTAELDTKRTDVISVMAGQDQDGHLTHTIPQVKRLRFQTTDSGAQLGVEIETNDGTLTYVRFRVPVIPETLDGVLL